MEDVADVDEKRTQKGMRQRREDTDKAYQTIVDLELKARFAKTERLRLARENSEKALGQKARGQLRPAHSFTLEAKPKF